MVVVQTGVTRAYHAVAEHSLKKPYGFFLAGNRSRSVAPDQALSRYFRDVDIDIEALRGRGGALPFGYALPAPVPRCWKRSGLQICETLHDQNLVCPDSVLHVL